MWLRYRKLFPGPPRPFLKVILRARLRAVYTYALADSGADHCMFPLEFALQLGLNPKGAKPGVISGAGGIVETYYWRVAVDLPELSSLPSYASSFTTRVGFTKGLQDFGLLGQRGFFDRFKVKFDRRHGVFEVDL